MATKIPIPKLGQSEETVVIDNWKVKEGDTVKKGDVIFEVETDKAVLEVESQFEGTILKILVPAGKEVPVMTTGAIIGEAGEAVPAEMLEAAMETALSRIAIETSSPSNSVCCVPFLYSTCTSKSGKIAETPCSSLGSTPKRKAFNPQARYIAPVSKYKIL